MGMGIKRERESEREGRPIYKVCDGKREREKERRASGERERERRRERRKKTL